MDRMGIVALERCSVSELHRTAQLIALAARRDVQADPRLLHLFDFIFQLSNFGHAMIFLIAGHSGLESKSKHMDVHDEFSSGFEPLRDFFSFSRMNRCANFSRL